MLVGLVDPGIWMVILVLVLPVVFVGLAVWVLLSARTSVHVPVVDHTLPDSPAAHARRRFTLGEITYDEYARIISALRD